MFVFLAASAWARIVSSDLVRIHNCAGFLLLHVEGFLFLFCEDLVPLRKVVKPVSLGIYHVLIESLFIKCKVYLGILIHGLDWVRNLQTVIDSIKKTDLCSIVYTSGSTAAPKGVEMTHEHYCTTALNLPVYMPQLLHEKKKNVLLFLPQAHSFARAINYICVASELHIYIAQGIKTLIADLQVALFRVYSRRYTTRLRKRPDMVPREWLSLRRLWQLRIT